MTLQMHKFIYKVIKYLILGWIGGAIYVIMEMTFRGRSHWTMFILGAICFILLGLINEILPWSTPIEIQAVMGSCIITTCEFITGCIVNLWLGWNIWDYSNMPLNLLGQICLPFSLLWVLVSILGIVVDDCIRYLWFNEEEPHYTSIIFKRKR